jgi:hypothetical protein
MSIHNEQTETKSISIPTNTNETYSLNNITIINENIQYPIKTCLFTNITYARIGKCFWMFPKPNTIPKIVIGPHFYFYPIMLAIILFVGSLIDLKLLPYINDIRITCVFWLLILNAIGIYTANFLYNPGIVMKSDLNSVSGYYCEICKVFRSSENVVHCEFCGVCIEGHDHHCVWIGKCVGKNNKCLFNCIFVSICLVYAFLIFIMVYYFIKYS